MWRINVSYFRRKTWGEQLAGEEQISHNAVGFFEGYYTLTKTLQNFGYAEIKVEVENNILPQNMSINCHEFHKSIVNLEEERYLNFLNRFMMVTRKIGNVDML